jgi:hypothetical protein
VADKDMAFKRGQSAILLNPDHSRLMPRPPPESHVTKFPQLTDPTRPHLRKWLLDDEHG